MAVYSTYDAKTRLSEILRRVRAGQRVGISYHGSIVAEISPVEATAESLEARLKRLRAEGSIVPPRKPGARFPRLARRRGALKRFLESRE
jgi:prevent-host-death family protein